MGLSAGAGERLNYRYAYDFFGNVAALTSDSDLVNYSYDGLGRLTAASDSTSSYSRTYRYDGANRLTAFNGQSYCYGDAGPYHGVDRIGGNGHFDYDANGNMTVRNKGLTGQQTLVWDAQNRLSQVQDSNGSLVEQYWYDVVGASVKQTSGSTTTYTFFGHCEEEVTSGVTTAISHYSFSGLRIAVKRGSTLYHVHGDHLGSTSLTTAAAGVEGGRADHPYGAQRSAWGTLHTDRTFMGQKEDGTGLPYYSARYYDPALGTFISPDTVVPDAMMAIDYNRFLYAQGNPLKYSDPTGYIPADLPEEPPGTPPGADPSVVDFYWKNRWYNARGFARRADGHWDRPIPPRYEDKQILYGVMREDLLCWFFREIKGNTQDERLLTIRGLNEASRLHLTSLSPAGGEFSTSFKITAHTMWALLVGPGRPWDYKGHIGMALDEPRTDYGGVAYFYDVWASINFGYAGRAARFTHDELLLGAGLGQIASDLSRGQLWNYDLSSNFDDPADQAAVQIGMTLYDQYGLDIDEDDFGKAFQEEADNLLIQRP